VADFDCVEAVDKLLEGFPAHGAPEDVVRVGGDDEGLWVGFAFFAQVVEGFDSFRPVVGAIDGQNVFAFDGEFAGRGGDQSGCFGLLLEFFWKVDPFVECEEDGVKARGCGLGEQIAGCVVDCVSGIFRAVGVEVALETLVDYPPHSGHGVPSVGRQYRPGTFLHFMHPLLCRVPGSVVPAASSPSWSQYWSEMISSSSSSSGISSSISSGWVVFAVSPEEASDPEVPPPPLFPPPPVLPPPPPPPPLVWLFFFVSDLGRGGMDAGVGVGLAFLWGLYCSWGVS
jgi:hypothetical protein